MNFNTVTEFEEKIAEFFGSQYAVAVDSCTHGIELCLRYTNEKKINVPKRTYLSVPFLAEKLGIEREWRDENLIAAFYKVPQEDFLPDALKNLSFFAPPC